MKITKNNYEIFFLDYWEGNLNPGMESHLFDFLNKYPDLKDEFYSYEDITLSQDFKITFPNKETLKKENDTINSHQFENHCVAYYENDLSDKEKEKFELYLTAHPELIKEFELFGKIKFQKDLYVTYPDKNELKKGIVFSKLITLNNIYWVASLAAVIILFIGIFSLVYDKSSIMIRPELLITDLPSKNIIEIPYNETIPVIQQRKEQITLLAERIEPAIVNPIPSRSVGKNLILLEQTNNVYIFSRYDIFIKDNFLAIGGRNNSDQLTKKSEKTAFGRILSNLGGNIQTIFAPTKDAIKTESRNKFWSIAESGVNGYNLLTNNSYELVRVIDKDGKTKQVKFLNEGETFITENH